MPESPKNFADFLANHWPHFVAKVEMIAKVQYIILASIIGAAIVVLLR